MVLGQSSVVELVKDVLWPAWESQRAHLDWIDGWYRWTPDPVSLPKKSTPEHRYLAGLSDQPWLNLVVTTSAQCMYVDVIRSSADVAGDVDLSGPGPWRTWMANRFDRRQAALYRAALAYGIAYNKVLPGQDERTGESMPVMRGVSPRRMLALYRDPAEDDWPEYTIEVGRKGTDGRRLVEVMDFEATYRVSVDEINRVEFIDYVQHDVGVTPVVRYCNMLDLDGRTPGEVEPFIKPAARINKSGYDRMLTQHHSSWKIRTVSGMAEPDTEEEANRKKLQLRQDDLLVAEDPDTKFGTLDETPLGGFIDAWRADIEALAALSQTPTHALTGQLINLSAEALAAARAGLTQKVAERQKSFGSSHVQALQLAAAIEGDEASARDVRMRVSWEDMEIRSMAQAVDALGKASQMLGVPPQALWGRIPGVEKSDVDEWSAMARSADPTASMLSRLESQFGLEDS